ncbi:hypothetical protein CGGC5_v004621 [Colletotrichum fructicola Nara gc5]|uniref:Uncharacterized protein n=1 Tax=Colletotrichum fructicola (strain Nara gc5) TaxID=1213859 RepID=A0A7J6JHJ3_COLFN|nr:hypothetical protein CGGC5_v004621 [Colletotrichum fructicola Nara gc5]
MFLVVLILILKNFAPIADSNNIEVAKLLRLPTEKLDRDDLALHRQASEMPLMPDRTWRYRGLPLAPAENEERKQVRYRRD